MKRPRARLPHGDAQATLGVWFHYEAAETNIQAQYGRPPTGFEGHVLPDRI